MPAFFNKKQITNPQDHTKPKRWYCVLRTLGLVRTPQLAKLAAEDTTINAKEIELGIYLASKVILRQLCDGHSVELGSLGRFRLTAKSNGADSKEELSGKDITEWTVRFTLSDEARDIINTIEFRDAESLTLNPEDKEEDV